MTPSSSASTAGTSRLPWSSCRKVNEKLAQQLSNRRVRAGVKMTVVGPLASISSCTTALLRTTVPTRVSLSCSAGGAFADSNWELV
jgi:hypothetical protein